jgi:hypothetical protein
MENPIVDVEHKDQSVLRHAVENVLHVPNSRDDNAEIIYLNGVRFWLITSSYELLPLFKASLTMQ